MKFPDYLTEQIKITPELALVAEQAFTQMKLPKGYYLFQADEICSKIFYIEKGFARAEFVSESGREITTWFFPEGSFVTSINSFYNGAESNEACILSEDSVVYSLSYSDFNGLLNKHAELGRFCFAIVFEIARMMAEYINSGKFLTAEEKYFELIKRHPLILQKATLGQIASFLGITQETLSRIRSKK